MTTEKRSFSLRKRGESFKYATNGIVAFIKHEHNAWIHIAALILVIIAGIIFSITATEWALIAIVAGMVLMAEAFNTAIEYLCNHVAPTHQPLIGKVKDIAAGAVFIAAIAAIIVGVIIFTPYLLSYFV